MYSKLFAFILFFISFTFLQAQEEAVEESLSEEEMLALYQAYTDSVEKSLTYEYDNIALKEGLASIQVPTGYKYLNGKDSDMILTKLWGNPPSEGEDVSLGMLLPENFTPMADSSFAINITYTEEGYIDDEDASDIDYDEMLETMQSDAKEINSYRIEQGYDPVYLIGWASPPFYDAANKKLHWAKELKFGEAESNTLNYNIRVLGRKGYLQLNVIGEMYMLEQVKTTIDPILASVNFEEGNAYADFDPEVDKVAAYGVGALIAGKVLAKAGIFAKFGVLLAKFWKIIAVAVVAVFGGIKKFFFNKKEDKNEA